MKHQRFVIALIIGFLLPLHVTGQSLNCDLADLSWLRDTFERGSTSEKHVALRKYHCAEEYSSYQEAVQGSHQIGGSYKVFSGS